ncbi:oligosaccharide flippase family protein [Natrinema sp. 1APR25-10V2]|uniref:oligosaccharide flippase family protein n=1 Tax=Natrinema sp. 1APR25-10V2 TaxID=2951081 RepID=UPI0028767F6E|nr:oligosaccharide flippase family protein [Natrinema sp. 1APR25-10V2]MDS0475111.1 oligosaccharide flippase family protein [Natrinema sp. 1APR25-10V2]
MSVAERIAAGVKATFVSRAVNIGVNGLLMVLLSSVLLSPSEYGLLFLVISIIGVAQLFGDLGIARSAARYIAEFKESDSSQVPHVLSIALKYRVLLVTGTVLTIVLVREAIATALGEPDLGVLLLVGTGLLAFRSLHTFNTVAFQGFNAVELSAVVNVVNYLGRITLVVGFVTLGWGVVGALLGYAVGAAVAAVLGLGLLYTRFYRTFDATDAPEAGLRRRILEYSVPLTVSRSAGVIAARVDTILIGFFMNPVAVGFYTLGKQISEFVLAPAGSIGFAVSPTFGEDKANDELDRAARLYESTVKYVLLLYVPATVGILVIAEPAVLLVFGREYAGAVPVVRVLSLFVLVQSFTLVTTNVLDFLGRARVRAIAKGVSSIANFGLNIVFIPMYGVVGAAAATVVTYSAYSLANLYIIHTELDLRVIGLLRIALGTTVISAVMGLCVMVLMPYTANIASLIGVIVLGAAIWASMATISGLFDPRETLSLLT